MKDMSSGEQLLLPAEEAVRHIHTALAARRSAPPIQEKNYV